MSNRFVVPARKVGKKLDKTETKGLDVVILAGYMGHRMKSYGPKCLLRLDENNTILSNQLSCIFRHYPDARITIVTGFESQKVITRMDNSICMVENVDYENTNTFEELRLGLNASTRSRVILIHGDLIFNSQTLKNIDKNGSCLVVDSKDQIEKTEIGVTEVEGHITIMSYGLTPKWSYIAFLDEREKKIVQRVCKDREKKKLFAFEAINQAIEKGARFKCVEPKGMKIRKIESYKDIKQVRNENINR